MKVFCCLCLLVVLLPGCTSQDAAAPKEDETKEIDISEIMQNYPLINGSTSALPIIQEIYKAAHEPEIINGKKVWKGLPQSVYQTVMSYITLIEGGIDVAIVTEPSKEILEYAAEAGVELECTPICLEALIFITNPEVTVESLGTDQLRKIYIDRQIDNWSQLGGENAKIEALTRNQDSGSYSLMEKFVLQGEKADEEIESRSMMASMVAMIEDVISGNYMDGDSFPLGYTLYYYFRHNKKDKQWDDVKILDIDGVEPNGETISSRQYPYSTYYYAVIRSDAPADSAARKLLSWLLSDEGQKIISNAGFGNVAN
jgi:phosphate transport system substrate-binding protein